LKAHFLLPAFLKTNKKIPVEVYANNEKYYSEINLADRSVVG
jgi:hypothetical protein